MITPECNGNFIDDDDDDDAWGMMMMMMTMRMTNLVSLPRSLSL